MFVASSTQYVYFNLVMPYTCTLLGWGFSLVIVSSMLLVRTCPDDSVVSLEFSSSSCCCVEATKAAITSKHKIKHIFIVASVVE